MHHGNAVDVRSECYPFKKSTTGMRDLSKKSNARSSTGGLNSWYTPTLLALQIVHVGKIEFMIRGLFLTTTFIRRVRVGYFNLYDWLLRRIRTHALKCRA